MTLASPTRLEVECAAGAYPIFIEPGLIHASAELLAPYVRGNRLIIVSDEQAWAEQGPRLKFGLAGSAIEPVPIIVRPGEQAKGWPSLVEIVDRLLDLGVERTDTIVAFGGGVVGDLTGFAASILKRGCSYIQIPTTLLAQVDSSVGGKTGINVKAGKNLVGAFHHPKAVLIDPTTLDTLPARQVRAGYAEIVKYGLIGDAGFFNWCEAHGEQLIAGDLEARLHAIKFSIAAKARIVAEDERETSGKRQLLNFGHTFGHALEAETGFGDALLHGEAVAIGMALAFDLSAEIGLCRPADADRVRAHLGKLGLLPGLGGLIPGTKGAELVTHMLHDKKARRGKLPLILSRGIGTALADESVGPEAIASFLDREIAKGARTCVPMPA